jgi:DNA-binding beta-propeller fold protein YncE
MFNRCLFWLFTGAVPFAALAAPDTQPAKADYQVSGTLNVGGDGRWDYASFDPTSHLLYVTRVTHTQVIDPASGKVVGDIGPTKGSHGVAIDAAAGRGFITDGRGAAIVVFDPKTNAVLGQVAAADDADGLIYDPGSDRVLATCGDSNKLVVLDPSVDLKSGKADAVDLGGAPEFVAADGHGKAFVAMNRDNNIAVVDIKALQVTAHWPTAAGARPTGMAIDPAKHVLFIGCRNQKMIVMSTDDGHVLADLPIGNGNDACAFDASTGEAFASCGDGTTTVIKETSPGTYEVIQTIHTAQGARTIAVDSTTNTAYLPTAEFLPIEQGQRRPQMKPGTFKIVVVTIEKQKHD